MNIFKELLLRYLFFCICAFYAFKAPAQISISGSSCATVGNYSYYYIDGNYSTSSTMQWCVSSNGTIVQAYGNNVTGSNTCKSGTDVEQIVVLWNSVGNSQVTLTGSDGTAPPLAVTVVAALNPGSISSNKTQTINYNTVPASINCSAASNGYCSPSYSYQWQLSQDNIDWNDISGANSLNLSFSSAILQTTYYRREVTENNSSISLYSDVATVFVNPPFSSVMIAPSSQNIFSGSAAAAISGPAASGGSCNGNYVYQWQKSTNGGSTFSDIGGATGLSYSPGALTASTSYKRKDMCGSQIAYSNVAVVNVFAHLSGGTISPTAATIQYNTDPGITATAAQGGMGGSYVYQWQKSMDGGNTYVNINSPAGNLIVNTYFRRKVICGSETAYSNVAIITVNPELFPGSVSPDNIIVPSGSSPGQISAGAGAGGACNGNYAYQWQKSTDGGVSFSDISGATSQNYTPGNLTATTYFRRKLTCGTDVVYSSACQVTVGNTKSAQNYIRERDITKPGILTADAADQLTASADVKQVTQYYDGLGRLDQTVNKQGASDLKDLVTSYSYDRYGREEIKYLAYAASSNDGSYKPDAFSNQITFNSMMYPGEHFFYGQTNYESSPLNKTTETLSPGNSWVGSGRGVTYKYCSNTAVDAVRIWNVTLSSSPGTFSTYATSATYAAGQLYKNITTDEAGKQSIEFKDKKGKIILKKVQLTALPDNGEGS